MKCNCLALAIGGCFSRREQVPSLRVSVMWVLPEPRSRGPAWCGSWGPLLSATHLPPFFSIILGQHGRLRPQNAASQRGEEMGPAKVAIIITKLSMLPSHPQNKGLVHAFTVIHLGDQSPLAQGMYSAVFAECWISPGQRLLLGNPHKSVPWPRPSNTAPAKGSGLTVSVTKVLGTEVPSQHCTSVGWEVWTPPLNLFPIHGGNKNGAKWL